MTKKDFELIAQTLLAQKQDASSLTVYVQREYEMTRVRLVAESLAHSFSEQFPRFNIVTFLTACGY